MKLRKNWKRFWTLNRHHAEGFTLVELIVVIAILAILGGVAVPAYSGYVKKANMQADMTLISEIEHALTLAYYNQDLAEGEAGCLWLSPVLECYTEGENVAQAMEKTFGSNWLDTMQLQYDNWGVKNQMLSSADAKKIVDSGFVQNYSSDELMAQVQAMTDAVNGLSFEIGDTKVELYNMFNYENGESTENVIEDVIEEYGISKSWDEMSSTEKSNVLVLATASSISNGKENGVATVIPQYALYTAYAAENAEFKEAYNTFQTTIANVDPESADSQYDQIKAAYRTLQTAATANGFNTWKTSNGDGNQTAFEAIMAGVGNAMKDNGDKILGDLGNANMFTSGVGNELYNDYLKEVYATANNDSGIIEEFMAAAEPGEVLIQYTVADGKLYVVNSLPVG